MHGKALSVLVVLVSLGAIGCGRPRSSGGSNDGAVPDASPDLAQIVSQLFPKEVYGPDVSEGDAVIFAGGPNGSAPFVFNPPDGAIVPGEWPSPEFLVHTAALPSLVRLEVSAAGLRTAYTARPIAAPKAHADSMVTGTWWTIALPTDLWEQFRGASSTDRIDWRVLFTMAASTVPEGATAGSLFILRDAAKPDVTFLQIGQAGGSAPGFSIERLAVGASSTTLVPRSQEGRCIGCHAVSPDGKDIAYQTQGGREWITELVRPQMNGAPIPSPTLSASAAALLDSDVLMVPMMSGGAWSDTTGRWLGGVGYRTGVRDLQVALVQIDAIDAKLEFAPAPPSLQVALPTWSPDGKTILYVATESPDDGRTAESGAAPVTSDLWQVPVSVTKEGSPIFGEPVGVPFASATPELETYPSYSSDGKLIAYMRAPAGTGGYDEEQGDIYIVSSDGKISPVRIAANNAPRDASVFAGKGLTNSWPRFDETVYAAQDGSTYYFLVFNSRRGSSELWQERSSGSQPAAGRPIARLYLTAIRVIPGGEFGGTIESYPAVLIPGQRVDAGGHTAAFKTVTSVPPPIP